MLYIMDILPIVYMYPIRINIYYCDLLWSILCQVSWCVSSLLKHSISHQVQNHQGALPLTAIFEVVIRIEGGEIVVGVVTDTRTGAWDFGFFGPQKPVIRIRAHISTCRGYNSRETYFSSPFIGVITPFITSRGPPCVMERKNPQFLERKVEFIGYNRHFFGWIHGLFLVRLSDEFRSHNVRSSFSYANHIWTTSMYYLSGI